MKLETTPNGNLTLISEPEDAEMLAELKRRHEGDDIGFLCDLLDHPRTGWQGNGVLMHVKPEDIGAMTDAPIVTDDVEYGDDGTVNVRGNVWWFPNYMIENFAETLIEKGRVLFRHSPPIEEKPKVPTERI